MRGFHNRIKFKKKIKKHAGYAQFGNLWWAWHGRAKYKDTLLCQKNSPFIVKLRKKKRSVKWRGSELSHLWELLHMISGKMNQYSMNRNDFYSWCRGRNSHVAYWQHRAITRSADLPPKTASNLDDKHLSFSIRFPPVRSAVSVSRHLLRILYLCVGQWVLQLHVVTFSITFNRRRIVFLSLLILFQTPHPCLIINQKNTHRSA